MKKIVKGFLSVFVFAVLACLCVFADDTTNGSTNSDSKSVISLNVSVSGSSLLVNDEAEEGVLAVAVAIYDKSGENLVTVQTAAVDDDNNYQTSLELEDGSYVIKVADYEGGSYLTKKITVGIPEPEPSDDDKDKKDKKHEERKDAKDKDAEANEKGERRNAGKARKCACKMYFPQTSDSGNCILLMASLAAATSLGAVFSVRRKKKDC